MRKVWFLLLLCPLIAFNVNAQDATPTPETGLDRVCKSITTLPNSKYIYKNSAPLRSGGVGTPLIGYRKEPTLIGVARNTLLKSGTKIYDQDGTIIGSCPWASAHDTFGGRYRCTMQTTSLRRKAVNNTNRPKVYFKTGTRACVEVPDAGRCYGSVKGLCNQTIK